MFFVHYHQFFSLGSIQDVHDDWVSEWTSFSFVYFLEGFGIVCVGSQTVYGFGRESNQAAMLESRCGFLELIFCKDDCFDIVDGSG